MISFREPHVPSIARPHHALTRTGEVTMPSLTFLYGASAAVGALVGGLAYVGSHLSGTHPLIGSLAGGAIGGAATLGVAMFIGAGGGTPPTPAK